jgi:hypothetical protein
MILRREFESLFGATANQAVGRTENEPPAATSKRSASVPSR